MNLRRKIYLTLGICGILSILLIFLVIWPLFKEIKTNSEEFILKKGQIVSLEAEIENLEKTQKQYQSYQLNLEQINSLFVNSEVPVSFIRFLEKLAFDSGLSIKISLSSALKTEKEPWPSLYFQLSTTGPFSNFSKFLEKLENSPYLIEVQNLTIKGLTEGELQKKELKSFSSGDVSANLLISVFTQ